MTAEVERRVVAFVDSAVAVDALLQVARDEGGPVALDVVVPSTAVAAAVRRTVDAAALPPTVRVGVEARPPEPSVDVWLDYLSSRDPDRVFVDPALTESDALRAAAGVAAERLPAERVRQPRPLVHDGGPARFLATFLLSYLFYLALGDPFDPFDAVTGVLVAGLVAGLLASTLFESPPRARTLLPRLVRATLFVPYLLYEVARANVGVAYVVLHPSLPIDPQFVDLTDVPEDRFERAVLANAITLTPGTVTVDVGEDAFVVHALTESTRASVLTGSLVRAVGFVFHGRQS